MLRTAHLIGLAALPLYAHRYSPKKFTQPQLFACLALKEFLQLDYRKLTALLDDCRELGAVIGLEAVPHFTTIQKAARRLLRMPLAERLLDKTVRLAQVQGRLPSVVSLAAGDGSGWESHHVSHYYVKRRASCSKFWQKTTYKRFPKAGMLCDCPSHLILSIVPELGPGPDIRHFRPLLDGGLRRVRIKTAAFDAGYDAEHTHEYARHERGVRTLIPPLIGRPTDKRPSGYWRGQMSDRLHLTRYGQRWQVETVISMLKRLMGSALRARTYWSQCRETFLRAIVHNVMILRRKQVFYRAVASPFWPKFVSTEPSALNRSTPPAARTIFPSGCTST